MRDTFGGLFAATASLRRDPTAPEVAGGLPCGPFDQQLLNELFFALSSVLSEINTIRTSAGLIADETRVDQLLEAIKVLSSANIARIGVPYPEITATNNVLASTSGPGQVQLVAGQAWIHRGQTQYSTDDFSGAQRTFGTAASKVYHLVWDAPGTGFAVPKATYPKGLLSLIDRTAASPIESDASYDSTYDRMLIARVATDGLNNPTVIALKNKASLLVNTTISANGLTRFTDPTGLFNIPFSTLTLNWARRPVSFFVWAALVSATGNTSTYLETITYYSGTFTDGTGTVTASLDRYGMTAVGVMQTRVTSAQISGSWTSVQTASA